MRQLVHVVLAVTLLFVQTGSVMAIAECCLDHDATACHSMTVEQNNCHSDAAVPKGCCDTNEDSCCEDEEEELVVIQPIHLHVTTVKEQDNPSPKLIALSTASFHMMPSQYFTTRAPIFRAHSFCLSLQELQVFRC